MAFHVGFGEGPVRSFSDLQRLDLDRYATFSGVLVEHGVWVTGPRDPVRVGGSHRCGRGRDPRPRRPGDVGFNGGIGRMSMVGWNSSRRAS